MKQKCFLTFFMLIVMISSMLTSCNVQKVLKSNEKNKTMKQYLENTLCILNKDKDYTTYLTSVGMLSEYLKQYVTFIGNGDYFLTYDSEIKTADKENDIRNRDRITLHVIPESNDKFRLETKLESSTFYENGENVGHRKPTGEWVFVGYSDDKDCEAAKVLHYFNENRNK